MRWSHPVQLLVANLTDLATVVECGGLPSFFNIEIGSTTVADSAVVG